MDSTGAVIGWSALILVFLSMWFGAVVGAAFAAMRTTAFQPEEFQMVMQNPTILIAMVLGYLVAAVAFGAIVRVYLRHDNWAWIVRSTAVFNLSAADNVVARGQAAGSLGEGLADGLDVGGF